MWRPHLLAVVLVTILPPHASTHQPSGEGSPKQRSWELPAAFTAEECESAVALAKDPLSGQRTAGVLRVGPSYGKKDQRALPPREVRSTDLKWLKLNPEAAWLFKRVFEIAKQANVEAGWDYDKLTHLQNLQVGYYSADADPPGHYMWHADEDWQIDARKSARILSVSVQLSSEDVSLSLPSDPNPLLCCTLVLTPRPIHVPPLSIRITRARTCRSGFTTQPAPRAQSSCTHPSRCTRSIRSRVEHVYP